MRNYSDITLLRLPEYGVVVSAVITMSRACPATSKCEPDKWAASPTCKIQWVGVGFGLAGGAVTTRTSRVRPTALCGDGRALPCSPKIVVRPSSAAAKRFWRGGGGGGGRYIAGGRQRQTAFRVTNGKSNTKTIHFPDHYVVCDWNIVKNLYYYQLYQTNFDFVRHGGIVWLPSWTLRRGQFYTVTVPRLLLSVGRGARKRQC